MAPLNVILVDDSPEFLASAERFLSADSQIAIVARARSGYEALDLAARMRPDLVLVDLSMPGMNGLETTRRIKACPAAPRVIVMTLYDEPEYRVAAEAAGADGFVSKSAFRRSLLPLIATLCAEAGIAAGAELSADRERTGSGA